MRDNENWRRREGDVNDSELRSTWRKGLSDEACALLTRDQEVFLNQSLSSPCVDVVTHSGGPMLSTLDGKTLYDFHGNNVHQLGFGHPAVVRAVTETLQTLPFSPRRYTNELTVQLAERLVALTSNRLNKVLFAPAATLAVDTAIKLARIVTGKQRMVSLWHSFHGASLGALSVGGQAQFRSGLGTLGPETTHIPPCATSSCPWRCGSACDLRCADYLDYVLEATRDVAAVIMEPVRNTDVQVPPKAYYERVQAICKRHGVLLIVDETATCLGRTGHMFAYQHYDLDPDMVVLGKGLGGGVFPIAALLAKRELDDAKSYSIGHYTHEKTPVGAAAALAVIDTIEREDLCQRANQIGMRMTMHLQDLQQSTHVFAEIRQIGALCGAQLADTSLVHGATLAEHTMYEAFHRGLNFKVSSGSTLTLSPPLVISDAELDDAMGRLRTSIQRALERISKERMQQYE
ncbi:aspartate aminotransferase family protein [Alicyclobacillus fastidiosus]|uniref:Aspartate aminotransferase family protein n=1 Tax=Alicyclobacillus fastidiosus TaxID=392011 RepID=A0ABY6ZAS2_9BACL|nr:aspartate aminotransferase family protein [Alicyclobacillus fastidiosus]WAH39979.1 aspartate aminotransferase family protein [Alicyclobacillus fastidiosus]GMA61268.1 aspartate aminotransferase family protein [Alicyclobacillus fastidiosus]